MIYYSLSVYHGWPHFFNPPCEIMDWALVFQHPWLLFFNCRGSGLSGVRMGKAAKLLPWTVLIITFATTWLPVSCAPLGAAGTWPTRCGSALVFKVLIHPIWMADRRKFRSETSDNMDIRQYGQMKSRDGKGQRREEKKKEDQRRESLRREKIQVREKVRKSQNTVFFQWFVAPEGRKVDSLKRRVRSQLARWEMNNCILFWREAHFDVKMHKAHEVRTTFWSCDVEKVRAIVARSTFRCQNVQNTSASEHF